MGRKQSIFIDRDALLVNLHKLQRAALAAIEKPLADGRERVKVAEAAANRAYKAFTANRCHDLAMKQVDAGRHVQEERAYLAYWQKQLDGLLCEGLPYDLHAISGRIDLTPSERLRTNQALRAMEADGLVEIGQRRATNIWVTDAGVARAKELLAAQRAAAKARKLAERQAVEISLVTPTEAADATH